MDLEYYEFEQVDEFAYRFFNKGPKGTFEMRVSFRRISKDAYHLGFGVFEPKKQWLDDQIELRNGDTQKILATVANTALAFLEEHPTCYIYATGSTAARTRLYQMGINRILPELSDQYAISGLIVERNELGVMQGHYPKWKGKWRELPSGVSHDAFLIFKR